MIKADECRAKMTKRWERAERRYKQILARIAAAGNEPTIDDITAVEDDFSSFIQELRIVRFYFGEWLQSSTGNRDGNKKMDAWRDSTLDKSSKKTVWNQLSQLRDFDVHTAPIDMNHQPSALCVRDGKLLQKDGKLIIKRGGLFAECEMGGAKQSVKLTQFCPDALAVVKQFIGEFDQLA